MKEGAVVIPMSTDRKILVIPGCFENGGKSECGKGGWLKPSHGFEFMGGAVDDGERDIVAACREVREEGGLAIAEDRLRRLPDIYEVRQRRNGEVIDFAVVCFLLRLTDEELGILVGQGAVGIEDASQIRPRDEVLWEELERIV